MKIHRIKAVIKRHLITWPRDLENIIDTFWWPTLDIVVWGMTTIAFKGSGGLGDNVAQFILGGIILWIFVYRSQWEVGLMFLKEVWDRNMLNMLTTPLSIMEYTIASLILGLIKITFSSLWISFLAYLLYKFNIYTSAGILLVPHVVSLLVFGWSAGFFINGLVIRYGFRVQALAWSLVFVIQPFSAIYYPVSGLMGWMQPIARILPTSYIFESMRKVILSGSLDLNMLITAYILNLVYLFLAILFFKKSYDAAKKSGMIVKFG